MRGAAANRLVQRLANDLVESGLRFFGELVAGLNGDVHVDVVRDLDLVGERTDGHHEAVVTEDHGLEVEREVPELADRRAVAFECARDDLARLLFASLRA